MSQQQNKRVSFKNATRILFYVLTEMIEFTDVIISRTSINKKLEILAAGFDPWQVNQTLKQFEKQKYMTKKSKNSWIITRKGIHKARHYSIEQIHFDPTGKLWDGYWRVLIFDIPEKRRGARDILRHKIKEWGCYGLQNSVFVTPFNCETEYQKLVTLLSIQNYAHLIKTNSLGLGTARKKIYNRYGLVVDIDW